MSLLAPSKPPRLEVPLPLGLLPVRAVRSAIRRYRQGGSHQQLEAAVDRHGAELETAIHSLLRAHYEEYQGLVSRLEIVHAAIEQQAHQALWLRSFPDETPDPDPIVCTLPGGRQIPVEHLTAAVRCLRLDPRLLVSIEPDWDSEPSSPVKTRSDDGARQAANPAIRALNAAGVSCGDLARALECSKSMAYRLLTDAPVTGELAAAIERLFGNPELTAEIMAMIPGRNGRGTRA